MIFTDTFTVPAGTLEAAPLTRRLAVAKGIIHLVEITYLDGPEGLVHVILRRALHQLVPTGGSTSIVGNKNTVEAKLHHPLEEPPFQLTIDAWSPDASFPHQVTVNVHILPASVLAPPREELAILQRLGRFLLGGR